MTDRATATPFSPRDGFEGEPTRRQFVLAAAALAGLGPLAAAAGPKKRPRVTAVYTVFHHRSHAHDIIENFLESYYFNGKLTDPGVEVVSFYADQKAPTGDMTEDVARQYKVRVCKTIEEALCLGGKELAVDAVLSIGEHGRYPVNRLGQTEYPRKRFFDAIVAVMRRSRRFVPLFNDKHLSFRWDWAVSYISLAQSHRKERCLSLYSGTKRFDFRMTATISSKNRLRGYSVCPSLFTG